MSGFKRCWSWRPATRDSEIKQATHPLIDRFLNGLIQILAQIAHVECMEPFGFVKKYIHSAAG
jgi:hypothetical protein